MKISEFDCYGTATYNGATYILCEDIQPNFAPVSGVAYARAVRQGIRCDAEGTYKCVYLYFEEDFEDGGEACDIDTECEYRFDPEMEDFIELYDCEYE